jgi:NADH-quinone oxidoreductase subunit L
MGKAQAAWPVGSSLAIWTAALLLGGAVGKSAQLPLQTWLPDAMAGPTPVSALIHAATMVTAGVYLIARTHVLFQLAPPVLLAVAVIGAATLLIAGVSALVQTDLKRVLAYSTISQIGYMFLALGVGAWSAAIFHFMTHAFFKALLFLGAGAVLHVLHEERDMFKMGGLRKSLPLTFWTFLIGSASLSALPLVTAGFYSKDLILWQVFSSPQGSFWLWLAGLIGALLTSLYTFRMVFVTFFGKEKLHPAHHPGGAMQIPLVILAIFAIVAGFVELPPALGNLTLFSGFLAPILPAVASTASASTELVLAVIAGLTSLAGIGAAYLLYYRRAAAAEAPVDTALARFFRTGWGFDWLYDRVFVWPYKWLARIDKDDVVDSFYDGIAWLAAGLNRALSATETGRVRWYALGFLVGVVILVGVVVVR